MHTNIKKIVLYTILLLAIGCFSLSSFTLLVPSSEISISSRRAIDRLIRSVPLYILLSIVALGPWTVNQVRAGIFSLSFLVLIIVIASTYSINVLSLLSMIVWSGAVFYYYSRKYIQLHTRTNWTARNYVISLIGLFINCLAVITSIGMMARISDAGFDCSQIESSLRLSGLAKKLETTQLSDLLGISAEQVSSLPSGDSSSVSGGIMGMLTVWKARLVDLAVEQQAFLNHSICTLISEQIQKIRERPRWQIAGVLLAYLLFRPLIGVFVRILTPLGVGVRKLLLWLKIVHKKQIQLPATVIRLRHS